jgi:hypothetical protein
MPAMPAIPIQSREDAITETIEDWSADELMEALEALEVMLRSEGWRWFRRALNAAIIERRRAEEVRAVSADTTAESEALRSVEARAEIRGMRSYESIIDGVLLRATEGDEQSG